MKVVVSKLLIIEILVAILVLFVWFIGFNTSADYYPDIKDL